MAYYNINYCLSWFLGAVVRFATLLFTALQAQRRTGEYRPNLAFCYSRIRTLFDTTLHYELTSSQTRILVFSTLLFALQVANELESPRERNLRDGRKCLSFAKGSERLRTKRSWDRHRWRDKRGAFHNAQKCASERKCSRVL